MVEFIYMPVEEKFGTLGGANQENGNGSTVEKTPFDPTHKDFDFSQWSKAVKERMNRVLQKRQ